MPWLRKISNTFRILFRKEQLDQELDEEVRSYLEMLTDEKIKAGMTPAEARRRAHLELGGTEQVKEKVRDVRVGAWLETLRQDLRFGARQLRRNPGFTIVAVLTLALGIGANTAIFSVVNAVLLRPLPYRDADRLVWITNFIPKRNQTLVFDSDYASWQNQSQVFEGMAAYSRMQRTLTGRGDPERLQVGRVTAGFFSVLGVEPMLGRKFLPEEDRPGGSQVVVLSYGLWERRFGAERSVVGGSVTLDGNSYTVVGVMPAAFEFLANRKADLYIPFGLPGEIPLGGRSVKLVNVIARLKMGVTGERAKVNLTIINRRLLSAYPKAYASWMAGREVRVVPLHDRLVGDVRLPLLILLGAVTFVLLIACANVANLLVARGVTRKKEMAIRAALGAGRLRLVRQVLTESVLLAAFGGAAGLLLAFWVMDLLPALGPKSVPHIENAVIDGQVLLFTLAVTAFTGILFGLLPVVAATKVNPNESLKERRAGGVVGVRGHLPRSLLLVTEIALALVLLTGSGLLIRSFLRLTRIDPGFEARNVLTARVSLPFNFYREPHQQRAFFHDLIERVQALPGVSSAGATVALPLKGFLMSAGGVEIEGRPSTEGVSTAVDKVSPGYFRTLGIPLLSGRFFNERDTSDAPRVSIVNQAFARQVFPDESAVDNRIQFADSGWVSIVGVVDDVKQRGLAIESSPEVFLPYQQSPASHMALVIRTRSDPLNLVAAVRSQVQAIDKDLPVFDVATLEQHLSDLVASERFHAFLLGIFGGLALVLAAVGVYGVMAFSVVQRTHEMGIRMALGAERRDVLRLILGQGLLLIFIGLALGLAGSFALTRFLASLLFEVSATDPVTFVGGALLLACIALLACYIPARRAAKVDPMVALRYE